MSIIVTPIITATHAEWMESTQPIALDRVLYETDTGNYKVGDGISLYNALAYSTNISTFKNYIFMVPLDQIGGVFSGNDGSSGTPSSPSSDLTIMSGMATAVEEYGSVYQSSTVVLTSDNATNAYTAPNSSNVLNLVPNSMLTVSGVLQVIDSTTLDTAAWDVKFVIKQAANAAATVIVGTPLINLIGADSAFVNIDVVITADTTHGGVAISVTNTWPNDALMTANLLVAKIVT